MLRRPPESSSTWPPARARRAHDNRPAKELAARVGSTCLLGDKAYDSDAFRAALAEHNCVPVIPSNGSRAQKLP